MTLSDFDRGLLRRLVAYLVYKSGGKLILDKEFADFCKAFQTKVSAEGSKIIIESDKYVDMRERGK